MSLPLLLEWPDTLIEAGIPDGSNLPLSLDDIFKLVRAGCLELAEPHLYARLASKDDEYYVLTCLILCAEFSYRDQQKLLLLNYLYRLYPEHELTRWLHLKHWIGTLDQASIDNASPSIWHGEQRSPFLRLMRCRYELACSRLDNAQVLLDGLPSWLNNTLEASQCRADLEYVRGNNLTALRIWQSLVTRAPRCIRTLQRALDLAIECRHSESVLFLARRGAEQFGEHSALMGPIGAIKLYQRQPGLAQRATLIGKVWDSVGNANVILSNQLSSYEMNGNVDWMHYLPEWVLNTHLQEQALHSNLCMQLASIESTKYKNHLDSYLHSLTQVPQWESYRHAGKIPIKNKNIISSRSLKVAWVTGDLSPHPVSRFLLQFFNAANGSLKHKHFLVNTFNHGSEGCRDWFESIDGLEIHDVHTYINEHKVRAVRDLNADVAIDLSGWTSNHFLAGFMARLAPVQINYLGYYASSGISEMDYWLGDNCLFNENVAEFHSEAIYRLPRPFLAWQPCDPLPEAQAQIEQSRDGDIRFGSFNHNRKLSDKTLKLWAKILKAVPGSKLVLKANATEDIDTQTILRRRMLKQGIDPDFVEWLNFSQGPLEHLKQYRLLDVALDPIPNGGCTTSCEALWMGVPVITLRGNNYVSRMSTAVQTGAGMDSWVASTDQEYVRLAVQAADQLYWLRQNRDHWRSTLQLSPLGNASDLMHHLELAFTNMVTL